MYLAEAGVTAVANSVQVLHLQKRNAFACIFQMSFAHVCAMRNTSRFWEGLLSDSLCSSCCTSDYGRYQVCSSNCSAKKHYSEGHKMSSMALIKQLKHVQAGNSICTPDQRTRHVS